MEIKKSVVTINKYGKIYLCLNELLDNDEVKRNTLAKAIGTRFEVINKWYSNELEKMDLDVLARICYALDCTPGDILKYNKPE